MLVKIEGKKGEERLVVSSRQVAEDFGKRHTHVLDSIKELCSAENSAQSFFFESSYKDASGKSNREFLMNRDGFSLLVMGFTGEAALKWKLKYIEAFNSMENELRRLYDERKQWEIERAKGILTRHILADTIKNMVPDSPHKRFMYPNYTKLIYKVLFDATMEEMRKQCGAKDKESVRESLTADQLADVENLERLASGLINIGWGYEEIKAFLMENATKRIGQ
ncbi:MAG: Rha family transcriptional regulator [Schwartzia sp.]|nr:Rha family transcriptional regulator [Schwartzia sp. (in: firmicutes)]